ncbi:MAG: pyrimidine utilization protein D [Bdellovibrio sp.]
MKLPYQIHNPEDNTKPWLVLVNGLFAGRLGWSEVVPSLTEKFRVLTYDGRGQGEGPRPLGPYLLKDLVNDLEELLNDLEIEHTTLLGISNGGRIALEFARRNPLAVEAVVACDTYSEVGPLLKMKILSWKEANRIGGPTHRFDVATPWIWSEKAMKARPELLNFYRERAHLEKVHVIEALIDGAMEGEVNLSEIEVPVLFVCGEEDVLTPPYLHQQMEKKVEQSDLIIIEGGHASVYENPSVVAEKILPRLEALIQWPKNRAELLFIERKVAYELD